MTAELARFTITGGEAPTDQVAVVVRSGHNGLTEGDDGFTVVEVRVDGSELSAMWAVEAVAAVTYAAQLAGWPVKRTEWSEIGHPDYWPTTIHGAARVQVGNYRRPEAR